MAKKKSKEEMVVCPVGKFFMDLEAVIGTKSKFSEHMARSRLELLKGLRSLLDDGIDYYEKKNSQKKGQKMTKIEVE
jgi:hypothetical protein